jgi:acylphosphatase
MADKLVVTKHLKIEGRVQGVGFRYFTRKAAAKYSVQGWVKNMSDGTVEAMLTGDEKSVLAMMDELRRGPVTSQVTGMKELEADESTADFTTFIVKR